MHGLTPTIVLIFFLATAPVGLMPSIIALITKQKQKLLIVLANVALWVVIYFGARNCTIEGSNAFAVPTFLALLGWLFLVALSIRRAR